MVIVCGEALMDVFVLGDTPTGLSLDARVGGSPFNVAIGLARLGQRAAFVGALSRSPMGERLLQALRHEGVDTSAVKRIDAPTTLVLVGVAADGAPSYSFSGADGADRRLGLDALASVPPSPDALQVGSFAAVVEPIAATVRALVERERNGTLVAYDANVRLAVEPDASRWRDALEWMLTRAHVVKLSHEDLETLCPGVSIREFIERALVRGVRLVVVTDGARGATAATRALTIEVPAPSVAVVDAVGAGDTFQAALLTRLAERGALSIEGVTALDAGTLHDVIRFAASAASLTCTRRGADLPRRAELSVR